MAHIPVVDFEAYSINKEWNDCNDELLEHLSSQIYNACSTVGFVYLKNHGIPTKQLDMLINTSDTFFALPLEKKEKYSRHGKSDDNQGYVCMERESTNTSRPGDLKEAFDVQLSAASPLWPDEEVPAFRQSVKEFHNSCEKLSQHVLQMMAIGLSLKDKDHFTKWHNFNTKRSYSTLRCLLYPPLNTDKVKVGQIRCGEHSDYGSITLLFQDSIGGLEVQNLQGDYVPATPIPGTVLINIGDLMQRWTADKLVSTKHRVVIPEEEMKHKEGRRSIVFFAHPDDDTLMTCVDGSNKYPPIRAVDYVKMIFNETFSY